VTLAAPLALTETEEALDAALLYAGLGWRVFPLHSLRDGVCSCGDAGCTSPAKHPRTRSGCKDATTDTKRIRVWWRKWPDANVAVATGRDSGLVVIDVDPRHNGDDTWDSLKHELDVQPTWEVRTGGGGVHAYFSYPVDAAITIGAAVLGPGVDHRGDGGYVVAPPSNHASGNAYFWDVIEGEPLAELPATLAERLTARREQPRPEPQPTSPGQGPPWWAVLRRIGVEPSEIAAVAERLDDPVASVAAALYEPGDRRLPDTIPSGRRHDTCVKLAGLLRRAGAPDAAIEATLDQVAGQRMRPPWDDQERQREVRGILASTAKWKAERVRWPRPSAGGIAGVIAAANGDLGELLQADHVQRALRQVGRDGWDMLLLCLADAGLKRDAVAAVRSVVLPRCGPEGSPRDRDHRPWLFAQEGDLTVITPRSWTALQAANTPPRLFQCDGRSVRLGQDEDEAPSLEELTIPRMRHELARAAHFYVHVNDRAVEVLPPKPLVEDVLATQDPPLPPLRRIVEVPVFAPDGSLLDTPGYHLAGRTLYVPRAGFELPRIPLHPRPLHVQRAREWIDELLADFPFVSDSDRAHAVALFVLPYARDLVGHEPTPGHLLEAPTPGSGKSLLADVLTSPFAGRAVSTVTEARDDDEWRKRLTAQLRERRAVIILDNLVRPLDSGALASALTTATWEDRVLGKNETIRVPVRCIWVATGNNVRLSTELARRFVRIRIDPRMDRPFQRDGFRHNPLRTWVRRNRAAFVWSALVLVRAWLAAGSPPPARKPLGGYERWSEVVGGILQHAGIDGFLANANELYEAADTEGGLWRTFVATWWDQHGTAEVTSADLFELAESIDGLVPTRGNEKAQRTAFGMKLAKQHDRVFGEHQVVAAGTRKRAKVWRLHRLEPLSGPPEVNLCHSTDGGSPQGSPIGSPSGIPSNDGENTPSAPPRVNLGEPSPILNAREGVDPEDLDHTRIEEQYGKVHPGSPAPLEDPDITGIPGGEPSRSSVHPPHPRHGSTESDRPKTAPDPPTDAPPDDPPSPADHPKTDREVHDL